MSANSLDRRFQQPEIRWARRLVDEYAFVLDGIPDMIRLRFYQVLGGHWIETEQSHYLQTPDMAAPEVSETQRHATVDAALDELLSGVLDGYRAAVRRGRQPDESWLLPNRDFT